MKDGFLKLFEAAKALITYIDNESVFDRAAAGGCSGMDYHLSDTFYDLIVSTRSAVREFENGLKGSDKNAEDSVNKNNGFAILLEAAKALTTHVDKERAFDKVNDIGSVGIETYQSEAFIEVIQKTNTAIQEIESRLL